MTAHVDRAACRPQNGYSHRICTDLQRAFPQVDPAEIATLVEECIAYMTAPGGTPLFGAAATLAQARLIARTTDPASGRPQDRRQPGRSSQAQRSFPA